MRPLTTARLLASLAFVASAGIPALAQPLSSQPPLPIAPPSTVAPEIALDILNDGAASDPQRQSAADSLVAQSDSLTVRDQLALVLAEPVSGAGGCRYVLAAIDRLPRVSDRLFPALSARIAISPDWELPPFLNALARFRTRDSARLLIIYTRHADTDVSAAAMRALASLSGRDDIPPTPTSWIRWFDSVEPMTEGQWQRELVNSLATRTTRLATDRTDAVGRLIASLRQLYIASAAADRPRLLASWMGDTLAEIRDLGLELTRRELSVTGRLDPAVGEAAIQLLSNTDPTVRSRAAVLVRQLAPEGAAEAVTSALEREADPIAAADLLIASARWPSKRAVGPSMDWLGRDGTARDAAAEACCALARAAVLSPQQRAVILDLARTLAATRASAPLVCLLYTLGDDEDLVALVPLLDDPSQPLRSAAAEALLWDPELAPHVVRAASRHDDLFDAASRAILVHNPTSDGFLTIAALPAPSADIRKTSLARLSHGLRATDLLAAANAVNDAAITRALLDVATSRERVMAESSSDDSRRAIVSAGRTLAEADLRTGHPDAALVRLESLPTPEAPEDAEAISRVRFVALLALGRLDVAELEAANDASIWLEGLALAAGKEHENELVTLIESRFAASLTQAQSAELTKVKARLTRRAAEITEKQ